MFQNILYIRILGLPVDMMHGFVKYIVRFYFPRHNYYNKILQLIKVRFIADFQCEIKLIKHQNIFHNLFFFLPPLLPKGAINSGAD